MRADALSRAVPRRAARPRTLTTLRPSGRLGAAELLRLGAGNNPGEPWCTVEKTYNYETPGKTLITEIWEGFGDPWFW